MKKFSAMGDLIRLSNKFQSYFLNYEKNLCIYRYRNYNVIIYVITYTYINNVVSTFFPGYLIITFKFILKR